jgi:2-polyprenyl-3-methyl-5-hydroxy-6-metoxy-1,4-benzoquinol methylase
MIFWESTVRELALKFATVVALPFHLIPAAVRRAVMLLLFLIESRIGSSTAALQRLFLLRDLLDRLISERAITLGNGEHPKHYLMKYHDFFIKNIEDGETVLDIGCGYGAVSRSIARAHPNSLVIGVENNNRRFAQSQKFEAIENLRYIFGEAPDAVSDVKADVIVLSNVLEHIGDRINFLQRVNDMIKPNRFLIRVPYFQRDWTVPFRKEIGMSYFNDPTHFIEHTADEFESEMNAANLDIIYIDYVWGEIWAVVTERR